MRRFVAAASLTALLPCLAGRAQPPPPDATAVLDRASNRARVLYPVNDPTSTHRAVSYVHEGGSVRSILPSGEVRWSIPIAGHDFFGGFDYDGDGWLDCGLVADRPAPGRPGGPPSKATRIVLVNGKTGAVTEVGEPLEDLWWPSLGYATEQWTASRLLFGRAASLFSLAPTYARQGTFYRWIGGRFLKDSYEYPSTAAYDRAYPAARPNAYGQGQAHIENSHLGNGLILRVNGQERLVFFTTGRVVQLAVAPFGPCQLIRDHPFLVGDRTDLGGRCYGLVAADPAIGTRVTLVSGTPAHSVLSDQRSGKREADPWGSIERHLAIYDAASDTLERRFFSSAHDGGAAGDRYQKRIVYPNGIYLPIGPAKPSRIAYNVFEDGEWRLHVSSPGSTADAVVRRGLFLWDIRLGGKRPLLIVSPTAKGHAPGAPDGYFLEWRTLTYAWRESDRSLVPVEAVDGALPHLLPSFRDGERSTNYEALYPVLAVFEKGKKRFLLERRDGTLCLQGDPPSPADKAPRAPRSR